MQHSELIKKSLEKIIIREKKKRLEEEERKGEEDRTKMKSNYIKEPTKAKPNTVMIKR